MRVSATTHSPATAAADLPAVSNQPGGLPGGETLVELAGFTESAARSRKTFAEERLKHLREQMSTLLLFNLSPSALAGHSARMAKELESAAIGFADSLETLEDSQVSDPAQTPAGAYQDMTQDNGAGLRGLTAEDRETAHGFADAASLLQSLGRTASGNGRVEKNVEFLVSKTQSSTARVADIMTRLGSAPVRETYFW